MVAAYAVMVGWLGVARFATFHNETFDLAFYARMAWGYVHGELWEPIVGANVAGLHLSPIVAPLGVIGELSGSIPIVLIAAQAAAIAGAAWPLASMGYRRMGAAGAWLGALGFLLFPSVGHVATYEVHPGTMAVLPLAFMIDGIDRASVRATILGAIGVLLCREDLALVTGIAGLLAWRAVPELRRAGRVLALVSLGYFLVFALVLHPMLGPETGSMQLHFGKWGDSVAEAVLGIVTSPGALFDHLTDRERLLYLPKLLFPLALLPLFRPRFLILAIPPVAMNLLSEWPTAVELDSHYQITLLPALVASAIEGASRVARELAPRLVAAGASVTLIGAHLVAGGTPIARDFDAASFRWDARSSAATRALAHVPPEASVQAPYALMPHVAERVLLGPPPPPDRNYDVLIFDAWHRQRYAQDETLLRTAEEPTLRDWLARDTHGLVAVEWPYLVLARGADSRAGPAGRYLDSSEPPTTEPGRRLAACISLTGARIADDTLVLELAANDACPRDLAIRLGATDEMRPRRVDLLFDGLLSPEQLRAGDRVWSRHSLSDGERDRIRAHGLRIGLLRSSGARPEHADPVTIDVAVP